MSKRAFLVVLDSVGIGAMPDAERFGDVGADTLGNLARAFPDGINLPHLGALGLGNIADIRGVAPHPSAKGAWGKAAEAGPGKDTTLGHWEIAGLIAAEAFPTYPDGFPREVLDPFEKAIGHETLGNLPASGTEIIQRLGDIHVRSRKPIVYTSGDSVFQIACHEDVHPPEALYDMCRKARAILDGPGGDGPHRVARVIARPFVGSAGHYRRTTNRKDFSVPPPAPTLLDRLKDAGLATIGIGKIGDIFDHRGLTAEISTKSNEEGVLATLMHLNEAPDGLVFTNLVDTDMIYGHRRDVPGYRGALEAFDVFVPKLLQGLHKDDLLVITADHGCDPTFRGSDHTREYAPLLVYGKRMPAGVDLGTRTSFADTAAALAEFFEVEGTGHGTSWLPALNLAPADAPRTGSAFR